MNEYQLTDLGDGRFALSGVLTFKNVSLVLKESLELFEHYTQLEIDLAGIEQADSAGLALLLEWVNWAKYSVREIRFLNLPEQVLAMARISEVDNFLASGERWTGRISSEGESVQDS